MVGLGRENLVYSEFIAICSKFRIGGSGGCCGWGEMVVAGVGLVLKNGIVFYKLNIEIDIFSIIVFPS